jgi:hypothetical protein
MEQNDALLTVPKTVIKLSVVLVICKFIILYVTGSFDLAPVFECLLI